MAARVIFLLFMACFVRADDLEDATGQWAKKILTHFAPDQVAHVSWAPAIGGDAASVPLQTRAKALLARALQRRTRNPRVVEVKVTWSESAKEYVMVAEIKADPETIVEIATMPKSMPSPASENIFRVEKRLAWQQESRILDLTIVGDEMLVLDADGLARYQRQDGSWKKVEDAAMEMPVVRDARGHLSLEGDIATAEVAGFSCRGPWRPMFQIECSAGGRFTAARNTLSEAGWPAHFARAEWAGRSLVADTDGSLRIYDGSRVANGTVEGIGDSFVAVNQCPGGMILASGAETRGEDTLALYGLEELKPVRRSDAVDVPGPVTEMWPSANGALAMVHNLGAQRYEAYIISVDCGR